MIVGLGNPGRKYAGTRHNVGFDVLDLFAHRHGIRIKKRYCQALIADLRLDDEKFLLAKPQTFMNNTGEVVRDILQRMKIDSSSVLVICDDVNLPLGKIRLRPRGSAGGHHGLESIIDCTHSQEFARLRVGVGEGKDKTDVTDHVLGRFHKAEMSTLTDTLKRSVDCVDMIIIEGIEAAMNAHN